MLQLSQFQNFNKALIEKKVKLGWKVKRKAKAYNNMNIKCDTEKGLAKQNIRQSP